MSSFFVFGGPGVLIPLNALLGRCSTIEPYTQPFFALVIFPDIVSNFCPEPALDYDPAIYIFPFTWDQRCVLSCLTCLLRYGSLTNFLPGLASNQDPSDHSLLNSWGYKHESATALSLSECFF
jgi:hypothetical protein